MSKVNIAIHESLVTDNNAIETMLNYSGVSITIVSEAIMTHENITLIRAKFNIHKKVIAFRFSGNFPTSKIDLFLFPPSQLEKAKAFTAFGSYTVIVVNDGNLEHKRDDWFAVLNWQFISELVRTKLGVKEKQPAEKREKKPGKPRKPKVDVMSMPEPDPFPDESESKPENDPYWMQIPPPEE